MELHNEILTVAEVAKLLRCSQTHIKRQVARGNIPGARKIGDPWRFSSVELLKMFKEPVNGRKAKE